MFAPTNQAVGSSNLSGRAKFNNLQLFRVGTCPIRAKNIQLIGQVLSLHTFPVYTTSVTKLLTGYQKVGVDEIRKEGC